MLRKSCLVLLLLAAGSIPPAEALALGGNLKHPSISIPLTGQGGTPDPAGAAMSRVLAAHDKEFTGGYFLNARSVLHYAGGAKTINALLAGLARVDGAAIHIRFSKEAGKTEWGFPGEDEGRACDCSIEHDGWGDGRSITLNVFLGGKGVDPGELEIPAVVGR